MIKEALANRPKPPDFQTMPEVIVLTDQDMEVLSRLSDTASDCIRCAERSDILNAHADNFQNVWEENNKLQLKSCEELEDEIRIAAVDANSILAIRIEVSAIKP